MVRQYSRYIMKNLGWSALLITFSLTSIVWLTQALRFIDFIVNRGVSFTDFLHLALLLIPSLLLIVLPISFFIAVLYTYHRHMADSELIVLSGAGLSRWQLGSPAIFAASLVMLFTYLISLYLLPATYRQFKDMQSFMRNNYASMLLQEDVFNSPVDGLTVFIRERGKDGILHGILVHDNRDMKNAVTMMAESGQLLQTPNGPRFLLKNGNRQENSEGRLSVLNFESYAMDISFYAQEAARRIREPEERYLPELLNAQDVTPEVARKLRVEAHQRLTWPAYALILTLLALAVIQSGEFNRRGHWKRVAFAVFVGTVVIVIAFAMNNMVNKHPALTPLMYANIILTGFVCLQVVLSDSAGRRWGRASMKRA